MLYVYGFLILTAGKMIFLGFVSFLFPRHKEVRLIKNLKLMEVSQSLDIVNIKIKMPIWQLNFQPRKKTGGNSRPGNTFFILNAHFQVVQFLAQVVSEEMNFFLSVLALVLSESQSEQQYIIFFNIC